MSKEETDAKFDDIAAFADVGRQLDMPVGNYSSGQFARLGFSVAVHVDCDIFIADEVLAVGDRPFKRKCLKRMKEIRESGITMFYVSHSAGSVQKMCDRAIVLDKGTRRLRRRRRRGASSTCTTTATTTSRTARSPRSTSATTRSPATSDKNYTHVTACRVEITRL